MSRSYQVGNILETDCRFILHGCNAKGVMGAGLAKVIRNKYPMAYQVYRDAFNKNGLTPGNSIWVNCGKHVIINGITQNGYGRGGVFVDYDAVARVMQDIEAQHEMAYDYMDNEIEPIKEVAMPLIGCGLAGGDWSRIVEIIEENLHKVKPVIYTLDGNVPDEGANKMPRSKP